MKKNNDKQKSRENKKNNNKINNHELPKVYWQIFQF